MKAIDMKSLETLMAELFLLIEMFQLPQEGETSNIDKYLFEWYPEEMPIVQTLAVLRVFYPFKDYLVNWRPCLMRFQKVLRELDFTEAKINKMLLGLL